MHVWGDEWFEAHGTDLNLAMHYIHDECKRRCGMRVKCKEKYGTVRWEYTYAWLLSPYSGIIHDLIWPGYVFIQWHKYVRSQKVANLINKVDVALSKALYYTGIIGAVNKRRLRIFFEVVEEACKKWPNVAPEIVDELEWDFGHPMAEELTKRYGGGCGTTY